MNGAIEKQGPNNSLILGTAFNNFLSGVDHFRPPVFRDMGASGSKDRDATDAQGNSVLEVV